MYHFDKVGGHFRGQDHVVGHVSPELTEMFSSIANSGVVDTHADMTASNMPTARSRLFLNSCGFLMLNKAVF